MSQPTSTPTATRPRESARRMAAWGRYTADEFAPVNQRANAASAPPRPPAESIIQRLAGQHRHNPPVVRPRFGSGDFRIMPAIAGVVTVLVLIALVAAAILIWPVYRDSRTNLTLGDTLVGMSRMADDGGGAVSVWGSFEQGMPGITNVLAGSYRDPNRPLEPFTIVVGKRVTFQPKDRGVRTMRGLAGLDAPVDYNTGPLGGFVQCAAFHEDKFKRVACLWVDHGTTGFAVFFGRTIFTSAELFARARAEITAR